MNAKDDYSGQNDTQEDSFGLRWSVLKRMEFIEARLYWDGVINRSDLMRAFAISAPQASSDLSRYGQLAPDNLVYDAHSKVYRAARDFDPRLREPSAREYLSQLLVRADQGARADSAWIGTTPPYAVVPRVRRRLEAPVLRAVRAAIQDGDGLEILYQSMSESEPVARWIDPHALVFDGARWHTRAWCHRRSRFADFVFARIISVLGRRTGLMTGAADREWNEIVELRIAPFSGLSDSQKKAIERDYGMEGGEARIGMRLCLTYYFERQLGLDLDPDKVEKSRVQLTWLNREEVLKLRGDGVGGID